MRKLLPLIFLFVCIVSSYAQNNIPLQFLQDPKRNREIPALNRQGTVFVSLKDISQAFGLNVSPVIESQKAEVRSALFTLKVTADNPFIIVVDKQQNASIVQLPVNVLYVNRNFYLPVEQFLPTFNTVVSEELSYDKLRNTIIVGRAPIASKFDVAGLMFEQKSNGFLIRIQCGKKLADYESFLKPIGEDTWLYVTIANAKADVKTINAMKPYGAVKKILVFQSPTSVQLTFRLKGQVSNTELIPAEKSNDILVAVHMPTEAQLAIRKQEQERNLDRERNRWKLDVVVIDAGHGGHDPGTIGVGKTKEKDVTLSVALKLGKLIEKNLPDVKVVYTRKTDEFVEVFRRGQIANQAEGKLFISIHCNSVKRKPSPANGFEIYLLRPGKTDAAIQIAEQENAVVKLEEGYEQRYQQLTEENFILLTMAQSAYVKYSEKFADILRMEMGKHLDLENRGVKQAGFYVLVGASMPNVLVETGYLSNRKDERILKSSGGQQRIAEAIFNGVKKYKQDYEKSLLEGTDVGSQ